jgi:hypothetical protein
MDKKDLFEWYAKVAEQRLKEMSQFEISQDCKTRKEFSNYLLNVFIAYYGLRCTCDEIQDWDFNSAAGHYQKCDLWRFCHIVSRCLDWAEAHPDTKQTEVTNGLPPTAKAVGIRPTTL